MLNGWNYDLENIPEGDARKLVTLEKDEMIWVGVRAYHHTTKTWLNNGVETNERVIAWRDMPEPANPRYFAVPKEMTEAFEKAMREKVIPQIEEYRRRQAELAVKNRDRIFI